MLDMLQERRSVRQFEPRPIENVKRAQLLEALLRAPTSRGLNPWEFIVIDNPETLKQLSTAKAAGAGFLAGAQLAIAITADPEVSDVWIEDCAIAAITLQYTATTLGLGSCWAQLRLRKNSQGKDAETVARKILGLPENFRVVCVIGLGYPDQSLPGHAREELLWPKLHAGAYGSPMEEA
ncbi:MAG: NAD(P)H-dependent dehydrogenase/reductase [Desulfuromonas sp.]|nr:MAG: NAD(P)H-dependent dehydrogenase/reductase [Desulfuromonas sp.]